MERKTKINAEEGRQEITITREFDLPLDLLFKAYVEPGIVEQWMGTKVLELESKDHGSYRFETTDPMGNKHIFHGVIHEFVPEQRITRTFEMANTGFAPWLEYLVFEQLGTERSKLTMQVVYQSVALRDKLLKMPFAQGINFAHDRLEQVAGQLKQ